MLSSNEEDEEKVERHCECFLSFLPKSVSFESGSSFHLLSAARSAGDDVRIPLPEVEEEELFPGTESWGRLFVGIAIVFTGEAIEEEKGE